MNSVIQKLNDLGYQTIDGAWYNRVADWDSWYKGNVEKFHNYTVWNGQNKIKCTRYSLGMAKKVCEDWANLLMNEKVQITLEGEKEQTFIDDLFTRSNFEVNMNELQEKGAARGTYAIIPRVQGVTVNERGNVTGSGGEIIMDYVTADRIYPLAWTGREITECAFTTVVTANGNKYAYLQIHSRKNGVYFVENRVFSTDKEGGILNEVALADVPGYENVPPRYTVGDKPQFVIGRYNIANNIEDDNPMGIAVFANAVDVLKAVDVAYDSYVNEFVLGKKRIMVQPAATKLDGENSVFDPNDVTFYVLPEDMQDESIIHEIDMTLRIQEHTQGLQDHLKILGFKCGFGTNYYKFENGVAVTATETIYDNQDLHESVNKNKIVLRSLLEELCRILLRLGNAYMSAGLNEETKITIDLDDSVFTNKEAQLQDMRLDVQAGLLKPELYIAEKYGVTVGKARGMMPGMKDLTAGETQDEVE